MNNFLCPISKKTLDVDTENNLFCIVNNNKYLYKNFNGSVDFTTNFTDLAELNHYNNIYKISNLNMYRLLSFIELEEYWNNPYEPWNEILLDKLNDIKGKTILLLGNGISIKELYFLVMGANLIYTDLSINAVLGMKHIFCSNQAFKKYKNNITFHAVDALNMPFCDETVDVIYGYAFVHHLGDLGNPEDENINKFFLEIKRILKKGGMCIFLDDAFSPIWQFAKKTILKPIQAYSHWKTGISPADLQTTRKGGYREEQIKTIIERYSFEKYFFERSSLFLRLWSRGVMKLMNNQNIAKSGQIYFKRIDDFLSEYSCFFRNNEMMLVWGIIK